MKPTKFKGQNVVFGADQPEYQPLPALRLNDGTVITCWELSDEEIEVIKETKRMYASMLTFNKPLTPIFLSVDISDVPV